MRASTMLGLAAALVAPATADWLKYTDLVSGSSAAPDQTIFHTDSWEGKIPNVRNGCIGNPGPPGMTDLCLDPSKGRGHFMFNHQGFKRCLMFIGEEKVSAGAVYAARYTYNEVTCTW